MPSPVPLRAPLRTGYVPTSMRLLWDDRPSLALDEATVRRLVDYCGPRLLEALKQLHDYGYLEHRNGK